MDKLLAAASMSSSNKDKVKLLPHNQMLYNKIVVELEKGERSIFYSEATGLGKSFIFMRLVQDYFKGKRILYIVPKIAIWENLTHYREFEFLEARIDMATFASFNKYNNELYKEYDVVFIDECHHMLSDIQGINVAQFLEDMINNGKYGFGMTATPCVKEIFVDEMWFNTSCYGYDIYDAIYNGILPKLDFAVALTDDVEIPKNLRAVYSISGAKSMLSQLTEERPDITHWLAYFSRKEDLEQNAYELSTLFPEYKVLKVYSGCEDVHGIIKEFEEYNGRVILLSVSMFLEGMHLKNVDGILLYRNVGTSFTYTQIIGRLCSTNTRKSPFMIDITNSIYILKNLGVFKSSRAGDERREYSLKDIFDVTARGYRTVELLEALDNIHVKEYRGVRWTSQKHLSLLLRNSASSLPTYLCKNPDKREEDWIDLQLKDYTYEEYLANDKIGKYKVCGYEYLTLTDLCTQLGVYKDCIADYLRKNVGKTVKDFMEERPDLYRYKHGCAPNATYKGYDVSGVVNLEKQLGVKKDVVGRYLRSNGITIQQFIDSHMERVIYRGVYVSEDIFSSLANLGYDVQELKAYRANTSCTPYELVDYALDVMTEIYKGVPIASLRTIAKHFDISINWLRAVCELCNFTDNKDIVDRIINKTLFIEYKGIKITTVREVCEYFNADTSVYTKFMKSYNNCTIYNFVDYMLSGNCTYCRMSEKQGLTALQMQGKIPTIDEPITYRGITYDSYGNLARLLGVTIGTLSEALSDRYTVESYIDYKLKDFSYKEYVDNGYIGKYKSNGFLYDTLTDLGRQTGYASGINDYLVSNPDKTLDDWFQEVYAFDRSLGFNCTSGQNIYRGFVISSPVTLGSRLCMDCKYLRKLMLEEHWSVNKIIDLILDEDSWYRGIPLPLFKKEILKFADVTSKVIDRYRSLYGIKACIDFYIDKYK